MATTRLRRTFKYPTDDTHSDSDSHLDEEEQEALITSLQTQSRTTDAQYIRIFTLLPLCCIPAFLFFMFRTSSSPSVRFICLLAITSLLGSSLAMHMTPLGSDGRVKKAGVLSVPGIGDVDSDGPLGRVVPLLNPIICFILGLAAVGMKRRVAVEGGSGAVPEGFWMFCLLPGFVLVVVWFAKRSIREVEEGIGELGRLKYGLKGA